ncbi:hypothetical protein [Rhodococcus pyridinivorans]|uniref:hypothetical protein n=1 Tax=Rhodococcus pyridinivorans TaxID=103816 RepID=UPI003AAECE37
MSDPDRYSKAESGGCVWEETDIFTQSRDRYETEDTAAIAHLETLRDLAEQGGIPHDQYEAPKGKNSLINRSPKPWVGHLESDGPEDHDGTYRQYRLYFGEAPTSCRSLLAALIEFKHTRWSERKRKTSQTKHIATAMSAIVRWCKREQCDFRVVEK